MVAGTAHVNVSGRLSRFFVDYDQRGQSAGECCQNGTGTYYLHVGGSGANTGSYT